MKNKVVLIIFLSLFTLFDLTAQSGVWQEVQDSIVAYPDDNIETVTKGGLLRIIDRNIDANGITYDSLIVINQNTLGIPVDTVSPDTIYLNKQADYTFDISANDTVVLIDDLTKNSYRGAYTNIIINIKVQNDDDVSVFYMSHNGTIVEYDSGVYDATKANVITIIRFGAESGTNINQVASFDVRQIAKAVTPTAPLYVAGSAEIGAVGDSIFTLDFDQDVDITDTTGLSFTCTGDTVFAHTISAGNGTSSINIALNRAIISTDTITFSISGTNTITGVAGALSFAGVTDSAVVNNVVSFIYPLDYIAYYPFSGNANDEGGNYNGTIPIAPDLVTGYYGDANGAYFWNANERIDISSINAEIATHTQGSISAWIYITSNPSDVATIWALGSTSEGALMTGRITTSGNIQFYFLNGASATNVIYYTSTSTVTLNQWVNVVITQNGSDIDIYIDGVEGHTVTSLTGSSGTWANGLNTHETTFIGARQTNGVTVDKYMQGTIDDVIIYDRALTQQEITDINQ